MMDDGSKPSPNVESKKISKNLYIKKKDFKKSYNFFFQRKPVKNIFKKSRNFITQNSPSTIPSPLENETQKPYHPTSSNTRFNINGSLLKREKKIEKRKKNHQNQWKSQQISTQNSPNPNKTQNHSIATTKPKPIPHKNPQSAANSKHATSHRV